MTRRQLAKRNEKIVEEFNQTGDSMAIAIKYQITVARVYQILSKSKSAELAKEVKNETNS